MLHSRSLYLVAQMTQLVSPSRPEFVAQIAVARLVCRPDDGTPFCRHSGMLQRDTSDRFNNPLFYNFSINFLWDENPQNCTKYITALRILQICQRNCSYVIHTAMVTSLPPVAVLLRCRDLGDDKSPAVFINASLDSLADDDKDDGDDRTTDTSFLGIDGTPDLAELQLLLRLMVVVVVVVVRGEDNLADGDVSLLSVGDNDDDAATAS